EPFRQRRHKGRRVGDMLNHLHAGYEVELALELVDLAGAIVDIDCTCPGMFPSDRDQLGGSVDAGDLRSQSRQRLGEKARSTADIQCRLSLERRACALVALPMLVDLVADVSEANRVELVQHRLGTVRVPPAA